MSKKDFLFCIQMMMTLLASLLLNACGKDSEELKTQTIDVDPFNEIVLNAVFDVELWQDDHFSIAITGTEDVTEDLNYSVENQKLTINNKNASLWVHPKSNPPKLVIRSKNFNRIEVEETCNIKGMNTITTDTFGIILGGKLNFADISLDCVLFYYWNSSPNGGKLTLSGHSQLVRIYNSTLMAVDASALDCDYATVETSSKSAVRVLVRKRLDYSIMGTGNIYLAGHPDEIVAGELYSSGRLIQ